LQAYELKKDKICEKIKKSVDSRGGCDSGPGFEQMAEGAYCARGRQHGAYILISDIGLRKTSLGSNWLPQKAYLETCSCPAWRLLIYLVKGGHVQRGYEAAVEMMPGGLLGMEPGDTLFSGRECNTQSLDVQPAFLLIVNADYEEKNGIS